MIKFQQFFFFLTTAGVDWDLRYRPVFFAPLAAALIPHRQSFCTAISEYANIISSSFVRDTAIHNLDSHKVKHVKLRILIWTQKVQICKPFFQ